MEIILTLIIFSLTIRDYIYLTKKLYQPIFQKKNNKGDSFFFDPDERLITNKRWFVYKIIYCYICAYVEQIIA